MIAFLDGAGLGLARARLAARLGNPDPFALRAALGVAVGMGGDGVVPANPGAVLTPEAADAVLVRASVEAGVLDPGCVGLFAGRPPGTRVRGVPVDDARFGFLRFPRGEPPPPAAWGALESWTTAQIGDVEAATVRTIIEVPGGVALGSDYGLTLWRNGSFSPFPWPVGCRREARRVEAMAMAGGALWVATSQALIRWDFRAAPVVRKHGPDAEEGWDELRCLLPVGGGLLRGYRTALMSEHAAVADGPADVFAMAEAPGGAVYAGTGGGALFVVGEPVAVRSFAARPHQPVRHLAFADGCLHVAAAGAHHIFDGASWTLAEPEPTAFAVDRRSRLWCLAEGKLFSWSRAGPRPVPVRLERPWCLCVAGNRLWVGGRESVWNLVLLA